MATRLTPQARREYILTRTREMIAREGPEGLSMRKVARECEMTAPGVMHHFETLEDLLTEVLTVRREEEASRYQELLLEVGAGATLRDLTDITVRVASENPVEAQNFDRLEALARVDPTHPAHRYYKGNSVVGEVGPLSSYLAQLEYREPLAVLNVLSLVAEGLRARWTRSEAVPDFEADWLAVADDVFAGFEHLRRDSDSS